MKITVAENLNDLRLHEVAWEELSRNVSEPNVFFEPWVLQPAFELLAEDAVKVIFIFDDSILHGVIPVVRQFGYHGFPVSYFSSWRHPHSLLCTPLLRRESELQTLKAFFEWLDNANPGGQFMEFRHVSGDGPFFDAVRSLADGKRALKNVKEFFRPVFLVPLEEKLSYEKILKSDRRKKIRKKMEKLNQEGVVEFEEIGEVADIDAWIEEFLALESSGWKGKAGTALANIPAHKEYFTRVTKEAFRRKRLVFGKLSLNSRAIAMRCGYLSGGTAFMAKIAYDESYSAHSPGVLLEAEALKELCKTRRWHYVDSCSDAEHEMLSHLWPQKRKISSFDMSLSTTLSVPLVQTFSLLRTAKNMISSFVNKSELKGGEREGDSLKTHVREE